MGAWDTGNFSNDTALDFVAELSGPEQLLQTLKAALAEQDELDADLCCEALAAADVLAATLGRPAPDMPDDIAEDIEGFGTPQKSALKTATQATQRIRDASELRELWDEDDPAEWLEVVDDLLLRLDADREYEAPERAPKSKGGYACYICMESIPDGEQVDVNFDFPDLPGVSGTNHYHAKCLEKEFEAPHFKDDGTPTDDLVKQVVQRLFGKQ